MASVARLLVGGFSAAAALTVDRASRVAHGQALLVEYNAVLEGKLLKQGAAAGPLEKVISLLKDMQTNLEKEKTEDVQANTKFESWCNTTKTEKTKAIAVSEAKIASWGNAAKEADAKEAQLKASVQDLKKQIESNKKTLAEATSIREKQNQKFQNETTVLVKDIKSIQLALKMLEKNKGKPVPAVSFLQLEEEEEEEVTPEQSLDQFMQSNKIEVPVPVKVVVHHAVEQAWSAEDKETFEQGMHTASALLQAEGQSVKSVMNGQIVGMLKQMADRMSEDKAKAEAAEATQAKTFVELQKAKATELASAEKLAADQQQQLSSAAVNGVGDKNAREQERQLLADTQKSLAETGKQCDEAQKSFKARLTARADELKAVGAAIKVLVAEQAKKKPASLLQVEAVTASQGNAIQKVIESIDEMVAGIKKQMQHETKKRDWCRKEIQTNTATQGKVDQDNSGLQVTAKGHNTAIADLDARIKKRKDELAKLAVDLKNATAAYNKEQNEYKETIADQLATKKALEKAIKKLKKYYSPKPKEEFLQVSAAKDAPKQKTFESNKSGAEAAISLMEKLAHDAEKVAAATKKAAEESTARYEKIAKDNGAIVDSVKEVLVDRRGRHAKRKEASVATSVDIKSNRKTKLNLVGMRQSLAVECDLLVKNYDQIEKDHKDEIDGLQQAKFVLSKKAQK